MRYPFVAQSVTVSEPFLFAQFVRILVRNAALVEFPAIAARKQELRDGGADPVDDVVLLDRDDAQAVARIAAIVTSSIGLNV